MKISTLKSFKQLHDLLPKHTRIYNSCSHTMPHYAYPISQIDQIQSTHAHPLTIKDKVAQLSIKFLRNSYDFLTRYDPQNMTEAKWITRCIILETVAAVPGMVGGMCRHLRSLRTMKKDNGWIHHLIEEADNQRFHLMIFLNLRKPTILQRSMVIGLQGIFMNSFFLAYLMNPKFCHRFIGYLEQQAVKTYTTMLKQIKEPNGILHHWNKMPAPRDVIDYYQLAPDASFKEVIMSIRADEASHREANHFFAEIDDDFVLNQQETLVVNQKGVWISKQEQRKKLDQKTKQRNL